MELVWDQKKHLFVILKAKKNQFFWKSNCGFLAIFGIGVARGPGILATIYSESNLSIRDFGHPVRI